MARCCSMRRFWWAEGNRRAFDKRSLGALANWRRKGIAYRSAVLGRRIASCRIEPQMTRSGFDRRASGSNGPGRDVRSRAKHHVREPEDPERPESIGERAAERVLDSPEATLLDLVDRLLSKGVMASGDLTLGVAGVDL